MLTMVETQKLANQLCGPLYSSSSGLGASVTADIASRTSVAVQAVATADPINLKTWPPCGVRLNIGSR